MRASIILIILIYCNCIKAQIGDNPISLPNMLLRDTNNNAIGSMPSIRGLSNDIFLKSYSSIKDLSGLYITDYKFVHLSNAEAKGVIIVFQLDEKFMNVNYNIDGDSTVFVTNTPKDRFSTLIMIESLSANAIITVRFMSENKLVPTITGIGGQLHFREN